MRVSALLVLVSILACLTASCGRGGERKEAAAPQPQPQAATDAIDITSTALAWADSVMEGMTAAQMAGQLIMPASYAINDAATVRLLSSYIRELTVGGVAFHKGDTLAMRQLADTLQAASRLPLFLAIDAENGLGMRLKGATVYPLNYELKDADRTQMYDYGANVGRECRQVGINMVFGPVLDVVPGPGWYMYKRSLGSDAGRVADLGTAYARGLMDAGVVPVAKHFPGHGYTHADSHVRLPVIGRSREEFEKTDLYPFRQYVEQGFPALMAAHIAVPALGGDSLPADFSPAIIGKLLRTEMQFDGLVISDAVSMGAVKALPADSVPPAVKALLAGVDIILAPADTWQTRDQILAAVDKGVLPLAKLKQHVRRILFHKYLFLVGK